MKIMFVFIITLFILLIKVNSFAETSIKAEVNKTRITTDETLDYKLTIISTEKNIPQPELPQFKDFNLISQSQSSSISFGKNTIKTILVYEFILNPLKEGEFKIESSIISVGGKTSSTQSFEIKVTAGKIKPQVPPKEKPSQPEEIQPELKEQITL
jgi:hypothetical protein